jgi:hypothetical protein
VAVTERENSCLLSGKKRREGYMDEVVEGGLLLFFFFLVLALLLASAVASSSRSSAKQCRFVSCYWENAGRNVGDLLGDRGEENLTLQSVTPKAAVVMVLLQAFED